MITIHELGIPIRQLNEPDVTAQEATEPGNRRLRTKGRFFRPVVCLFGASMASWFSWHCVYLQSADSAEMKSAEIVGEIQISSHRGAHVFFRGLDFEKVLRREVQVPPIRLGDLTWRMSSHDKMHGLFRE